MADVENPKHIKTHSVLNLIKPYQPFIRKDYAMCGYDPFYWYEKDLDDEYKERTGLSMYGFDRAMQEYESKLFDPYGDEYDEEEYISKQDYLETQAEYQMDEMKLGEY